MAVWLCFFVCVWSSEYTTSALGWSFLIFGRSGNDAHLTQDELVHILRNQCTPVWPSVHANFHPQRNDRQLINGKLLCEIFVILYWISGPTNWHHLYCQQKWLNRVYAHKLIRKTMSLSLPPEHIHATSKTCRCELYTTSAQWRGGSHTLNVLLQITCLTCLNRKSLITT